MSTKTRVLLIILIGCASAALSYLKLVDRGALAADFTWPWRAANFLVAGEDPYVEIQPSGEYPFQTYFRYPLTVAFIALPFAWLDPYVAGALFFGLSAALLAFAISAEGWKRMPIFLSAPFWLAGSVIQWSPLIVAAVLIPSLQWLVACKPNIGMASFLANPTKRGFAGLVIFLSISIAVRPAWPLKWILTILHNPLDPNPYLPPLFVLPLGPLLLLSARFLSDRKARLILAMSLVPQHLFFYDQLPLWLIPGCFKSGLAYSGLSWIAFLLWRFTSVDGASGAIRAMPGQHVMALIFLPALVMVLSPRIPRYWGGFRKNLSASS